MLTPTGCLKQSRTKTVRTSANCSLEANSLLSGLFAWGLRPRSYNKTGLKPTSVLVLVTWSYTFGLASNTVCAEKMLCDMIMLKSNKHLCSFVYDNYRNSGCQTFLVNTF